MNENQEMFTNYPDVVSPVELQDMLGICRTKAYNLLQTREIKSRKVGTKYKIPKINVIKFMQED